MGFRRELQIAVYRPAADDVLWMPFFGSDFHQPVFAVLAIERKCLPHDERCTASPDKQAQVRVCACHVHDHHEDKHTEQPTCENEQVLGFQPLELDRPADAFVDVVITHRASVYRKNERRMVAATIKKIHAPNHDAAVLLVSGSPLLNLLYTLTPPIKPTTAPIA